MTPIEKALAFFRNRRANITGVRPGTKRMYDIAIKAIERQRWIPVTERLPPADELDGNGFNINQQEFPHPLRWSG